MISMSFVNFCILLPHNVVNNLADVGAVQLPGADLAVLFDALRLAQALSRGPVLAVHRAAVDDDAP
jgi:hypothetical protein